MPRATIPRRVIHFHGLAHSLASSSFSVVVKPEASGVQTEIQCVKIQYFSIYIQILFLVSSFYLVVLHIVRRCTLVATTFWTHYYCSRSSYCAHFFSRLILIRRFTCHRVDELIEKEEKRRSKGIMSARCVVCGTTAASVASTRYTRDIPMRAFVRFDFESHFVFFRFLICVFGRFYFRSSINDKL